MLTLGTIKMWDERTPFGQHMLAFDFRGVGKHLANDPLHESAFATAFCLCHALELLLKSFLQAKGWTESQLRAPKTRHDLGALLDAALSEGLQLDQDDVAAINVVAAPAREFLFRYGAEKTVSPGRPLTSQVDYPHPVLLADVAERLSTATWPAVNATR